MKSLAILTLLLIATLSCVAFHAIVPVSAFTTSTNVCRPSQQRQVLTQYTALSVATDPVTESSEISSSSESTEVEAADVTIPTNLPSDCGMDYVPLASMLATGQLAEADQVR